MDICLRRCELWHHGIKGQKWGVRNGPPYPIEDTIMKSGTKLNSVSILPNFKAGTEVYGKRKILYAFNPEDEWDSKVYKGPFSYGKLMKTGQMVFEHQFETVKDLKMPTKQQRIDEFVNVFKNDKRTTIKDLEKHRKLIRQYGGKLSPEAMNIKFKKLSTESDYRTAYEIFNHAMELANKYKSTQKYIDAMSKKYDAMVDDNNQDIYNGAHDPIIIFNAAEALRACGNIPISAADAKPIPIDEVLKNLNDVAKVRDAEGKDKRI